jgi:hypothetical protein
MSGLRRGLRRWYRNFLASVTSVNEKYEMKEQEGATLEASIRVKPRARLCELSERDL